MTLEEAIRIIEDRFPCKMGQPAAYSETGEGYVQINSSGPSHEGAHHQIYSTTEEAVGNWLDAVSDYAKDKTGTLYWRVRPELIRIPGQNGYSVYSRLLISNQ